MAKIYERLLCTIKLRENRRDSFDPQRENLLGEDSICMVNLLEIPQVIFCFFYYMIDLFRLFQTRSFVVSSEHKNQSVATISTPVSVVSDENFFFVKQASKSKCRHYRYTVRSIHVKL